MMVFIPVREGPPVITGLKRGRGAAPATIFTGGDRLGRSRKGSPAPHDDGAADGADG